jgi:hypothetical protein
LDQILQNLEERLAKRKQIIEFRKIQDQQAQDLSNNSADSYNEEMTKLVQDGQLTEKQKKEFRKWNDNNKNRCNVKKIHQMTLLSLVS